MNHQRALLTGVALAALPLLAGCNVQIGQVIGGAHSAQTDRVLTAAHVPGSRLEVHTGLGSVEVVADPGRENVEVKAHLTASGATTEEAQARLADIDVQVNRRDDGVLEIVARPTRKGETMHGGCSFAVRIPDADGVTARTGNGSVTFRGLGGSAEADSGIGSVTVIDHKGAVKAHTGNGSISVARSGGPVKVESGIGSVTVEQASGAVEARTGNGSVTLATAGDAPFTLDTGIGSVTARVAAGAGGRIEATTGIGGITVTGSRKPQAESGSKTAKKITLGEDGPTSKIHTGNGSITVTLE
jgi:hypothetical protein